MEEEKEEEGEEGKEEEGKESGNTKHHGIESGEDVLKKELVVTVPKHLKVYEGDIHSFINTWN